MLDQVQNFIRQEALFHTGDRLILASSGGKDSMALLHILQQLDCDVIVAHCNFRLRGKQSDEDQEFLSKHCKKQHLSFRTVSFDTAELSKEKKLSIQELARDLRYKWLEDIRKEEKAKVIITAHHLQDNIETLLFKIVKGTGLKGIRGMLPKHGNL